jgi:hypothetical protein
MDVKCFVCNSTEKDKIYIEVIQNNEKKMVCVRCLPTLIHGGH